MMSSDYSEVCRKFKSLLKERGITYRELAQKVALSESAIKKILTGKDSSYGRLFEISRALGVELGEVLMSLQQEGPRQERFTAEQEQFFSKNLRIFLFYWKLVVENLSVEEIQAEFSLTKADSFQILRRLDQLGLLRLDEKEKVHFKRPKLSTWVGRGPLTDKVQSQWSKELIDDVLELDPFQRQAGLILRYTKMSERTLQEFMAAMQELELIFLRRAKREGVLGERNLKDVRFVMACAQGSFVKNTALAQMNNSKEQHFCSTL